jgi:hypothetical protein
MLVKKWQNTILKKKDSQNMTTFPPKKKTQVFDNFLFINERIWNIIFLYCKKKILRSYIHDSYNLCVTFTNPSPQWKIDKCDMMVFRTTFISCWIYYPKATYCGGPGHALTFIFTEIFLITCWERRNFFSIKLCT